MPPIKGGILQVDLWEERGRRGRGDAYSGRGPVVSAACMPDLTEPAELRTLAELMLGAGEIRSTERLTGLGPLLGSSVRQVSMLRRPSSCPVWS